MSTFVPIELCAIYKIIACQQLSNTLFLYQTQLPLLMPFMHHVSPTIFLTTHEQERASKITKPQVRHRFIAGRMLLRTLLAKHLDLHPQNIKIVLSDHGKPYQYNSKGLFFNLSHTGDFFAVVINEGAEVGVDIELHKSRRNLSAIAEEVLTPSELNVFALLNDDDQIPYFYRLWTLKEASLKAEGTGFSTPANSIGFSQHLEPVEWNYSLGCPKQWRWWYQSNKTMSCSVAVKYMSTH